MLTNGEDVNMEYPHGRNGELDIRRVSELQNRMMREILMFARILEGPTSKHLEADYGHFQRIIMLLTWLILDLVPFGSSTSPEIYPSRVYFRRP